jgi:hypothetical protein
MVLDADRVGDGAGKAQAALLGSVAGAKVGLLARARKGRGASAGRNIMEIICRPGSSPPPDFTPGMLHGGCD